MTLGCSSVPLGGDSDLDDQDLHVGAAPATMIFFLFACQASLSFTISQSLLKFMLIELVMLSNHLIPYCPVLLPSIFHSIRVFSTELALASGGQSIGASASVLPVNIQG